MEVFLLLIGCNKQYEIDTMNRYEHTHTHESAKWAEQPAAHFYKRLCQL